ncbi:MAG TPA: hypothetical protein VJR92_01715 [Gemmatimonadaceae bacterium]|nr:hypothetical protein [Gemmatimonadaceae bacterium]
MRRVHRAAALATILATAAGANPSTIVAQEAEKPALEVWRVGGEVVGGMYAGYVGYFAGRFVGTHVADVFVRDNNDAAWSVIRQTFGYTAGGFATAGAVYGIGSIQDQTGEFGTTVLGTGIGFVTALALNRVLLPPAKAGESGGRKFARKAAEATQVLLPAIGATIGFNSTRARR